MLLILCEIYANYYNYFPQEEAEAQRDLVIYQDHVCQRYQKWKHGSIIQEHISSLRVKLESNDDDDSITTTDESNGNGNKYNVYYM